MNLQDRFKFKVLIVEDDLYLNEALESMLLDCGYNVFKAEDGEKALEILDVEPIQFVVSDVQMPNKNGFELLSEIKTSKLNNIDVLMMTGFSHIPREKLMILGAVGIISKPDDLVEIPDYIETARTKSLNTN